MASLKVLPKETTVQYGTCKSTGTKLLTLQIYSNSSNMSQKKCFKKQGFLCQHDHNNQHTT